jgi:hypothetical protein
MIIKVRATGGGAASEFSSEASTWRELINDVKSQPNVQLSGMKILASTAEGETIDYTDEVADDSVALPNTSILTLMLVTTKVKSGSI